MTINEKFLPTEPKKYGFDIVTALLVLLFVAAFTGCYWYTTKLEDKLMQTEKILMETTHKYEQEKKGCEDIEALKKKITELKNNITFYEQAGYAYFGELSSLLPNNMKINDISVNFPNFQKQNTCILTLTLSGTLIEKQGIKPEESISNFIKSIKKSEYFKNATITNSLTKNKLSKINNTYFWNIEIKVQLFLRKN